TCTVFILFYLCYRRTRYGSLRTLGANLSRTKTVILALALGLLAVSRAWAGMQAPGVVRADAAGHFDYEWMFVVEQSFLIAGLGASNDLNTSGLFHGDCFCDRTFCAADSGDTLRWRVYGNLVNPHIDGRARNWVAGCEGEGGSSYTTVVTA